MNEQTLSIAQQLVPFAKVIGTTAAGSLAGSIFVFSYGVVPVLLKAPPELIAKQWQTAYRLGSRIAPPVAITTSACFVFLATQCVAMAATKLPGLFPQMALDPTSPWALYTAAAVTIPAIVPYTLGIMKPTNDTLHQRAEKNSNDGETRELLHKWRGMNYNRAMFALIGTLLGAVANVLS